LKASVIIPTCNRKQDLEKCLFSILEQSRLPDEIIVVDDGNLEDMPFREAFVEKGVQCIFKKKANKGLTKSRNVGVHLSCGDVIIFLDDDVVLTTDYVHEILKIYESGFDHKLGGVAGVEKLLKPIGFLDHIEFFYNIIFLISPLQAGGVTVSGFSEQGITTKVIPPQRLTRAETLRGAVFSFHKKVFSQFKFSEDYTHNYCQGEDKDFSIRVSKKYNLYIHPEAQLFHYNSPIERNSKYRRGREYILATYRLFSRYVRQKDYETIYFYYSFFGFALKFLIRYIISGREDEKDRMSGFIDAFHIVRKNRYL
jgi:glycosyltransferase involved in cell wall biosynthesis